MKKTMAMNAAKEMVDIKDKKAVLSQGGDGQNAPWTKCPPDKMPSGQNVPRTECPL